MGSQQIEDFIDQELGLNMDTFYADLEAEDTKDFVQWDKEQCERAGTTGTPTVFVCGERLQNRNQLEEYLDWLLGE